MTPGFLRSVPTIGTRRWRFRWCGRWALAGLIAAIMVAPLFVGHDPITQDLLSAFAPPSTDHPLGTDQYGRDVAARLAFGARRTLAVSIVVVLVSSGLGIAIGLASAATPKRMRWLPDRSVDIALGVPGLLLALVVVGALGPGQRNLVIAMVAGLWPWYARLARDHAHALRTAPFIDAARVGGLSPARIWATHVGPHVVRRLFVVAALDVGYTIVAFAGMSYLGLGARPPTPELGVILREGQDFLFDAPWLLWAPATVVGLCVLPFVLAGERMHERGVIA